MYLNFFYFLNSIKAFLDFYTVHPSMWTRLTSWWFTTFMAPAIKQKLHNVYEAGFFYFSRCSQNLLNLNDQKYSVHLFACKGLHREELNSKNIIQSINSVITSAKQ